MGPQVIGCSCLSRQTSIAVRKLFPQLRARLAFGMVGFAAVKRPRISPGGSEICLVSRVSVGGIVMERKAVRAASKKVSASRPEQVP